VVLPSAAAVASVLDRSDEPLELEPVFLPDELSESDSCSLDPLVSSLDA
jgi:hypothetical protein